MKKDLKNNYSSIKRDFKKNYKKFKKHYQKLNNLILKKKVNAGYGAGQMIPSFAYHLKNNLKFLDYIVDDNRKRDGEKYPYLDTKIKFFNKKLLNNKYFLITSLDATLPISKKLKKNKVKFINPLV